MIAGIILALITATLVSLYFLIDNSWHWVGLIGFILIGVESALMMESWDL